MYGARYKPTHAPENMKGGEGKNSPAALTLGGESAYVRRTATRSCRSAVVVQIELRRRRAQAHVIELVLVLVGDPRVDQVGGEDVALEQELVVLAERLECAIERARNRRDLGQLLGGQRVDVLVEGLARVDAVLDAV